jgi:predicted  nucleic acid-binding Zn-ribbon protein
MVKDEEFDAVIDRLAALQEFDQKLKGRLDQVGALTADADGFESGLLRQRNTVTVLTTQRDALEAKRAEMDAKLEIDGSRLRDNRMRLNRIRNDRELIALQREIDLGRESAQQLEEELIAVMESLEQINSQLGVEQEALTALEDRVAAEIDERRAEALKLSEGLDEEKAERNALAGGIDESLRSKYDQIFVRRGGTAVVEVKAGICQGCHMNLPPQMFNELQRYREVRQCPSCHRILYWRPARDEGAA